MPVILTCDVIHTTEKAVQVIFRDADEDEAPVWIPRSVIDDGDAVLVGEQDLAVRTWFCKKEGLE